MLKYAKIRKYDLNNWDGINSTIFFSGCTFNCKDCFNKEAQDFNHGNDFTKEVADKFIEYAKDEHVVGVCILGGEPFQQDPNQLYDFIKRLYIEVGKPIHVWTGYRFEDLFHSSRTVDTLKLIDTIVDGRFIRSFKDLTLKYRGSSNQRVIDVQKTLSSGHINIIE